MQYIDNEYAYLGCCRNDKACNVYFLGLYKYFYVTDETWSGWQTFRTFNKGVLPGMTNGQAIVNIKIFYTDNNGASRYFTFSPIYPPKPYEKQSYNYDPKYPVFSLRAGIYSAEVTISVYSELNTAGGKKPFSTTYTEKFPFVVSDYGSVVLLLFAKLGAKYKKYEKYNYDYKKVVETELTEHQFAHNFLQATSEEARGYYKWYDLDSNLIKNIPNGTPWGLTSPAPAKKPATASVKPAPTKPAPAKPAVKKTTSTTTTARPSPKPTTTTSTKSYPLSKPNKPIANPTPTKTPKLELVKKEYPKIIIKK